MPRSKRHCYNGYSKAQYKAKAFSKTACKRLEAENERLRTDLQRAERRIDRLMRVIVALKKRFARQAEAREAKPPAAPSVGLNYGINTNEPKKPKGKRRPKKSTGRKPREAKRSQTSITKDIYPPKVRRSSCVLQREQFVWRLIDGKAVYVLYRLFAQPNMPPPSIDGVRNSRSEYGIEIIVTVAFLVYWIGISLDKACALMRFFTGLELSKSQADSLLFQLANDWQKEYETIAELIAASAIIYIDETGWKVGKKACYTWIFSTMTSVFYKCGVGRGRSVLDEVLGAHCSGTGVSDNYSVYNGRFDEHQLCWAHFLRKAIALALRNPQNQRYERFLKKLFGVFYEAVRCSRDRRLSKGRADKVKKLKARIRRICAEHAYSIDKDTSESDAKFIRLNKELVNNLDCLFVFVLNPDVEPTNNRSERQARPEAMARKATRTSKSYKGAQRRGVIMSVLGSLAKRMDAFLLDNVLSEIERWRCNGQSIFCSELTGFTPANGPPGSATNPNGL